MVEEKRLPWANKIVTLINQRGGTRRSKLMIRPKNLDNRSEGRRN